jgi:FtsP/CotA-like multicopper oxidase with cupredoxin domain
MNRAQRFALLGIAAVIAVVAVFVLADSSEDDGDGEQSAATATATAQPTETPAATEEETPTATPTAEPTPEPPPVLRAGRVAELEYTQGDTVRIRARSDVPEEVHVHGYDLATDVEPGKTATMEFEADITGIFEIEFELSGEPIAELKVEPG